MTSSYFKNSEGIFLLYDITNKSSFENINYWIDSIKEVLGPTTMKDAKYAVILIGIKLELIEEGKAHREVTEDEAKEMCEKNNMIWEEK